MLSLYKSLFLINSNTSLTMMCVGPNTGNELLNATAAASKSFLLFIPFSIFFRIEGPYIGNCSSDFFEPETIFGFPAKFFKFF